MDIHEKISEAGQRALEVNIKGLSDDGTDGDPGFFQFPGATIPKRNVTELLEAAGWVYACISVIADEIANITIRLYKQNGDTVEEQTDHEIINSLYRANGFTTKYDLFWLTAYYLESTGEAPWYVEKSDAGTSIYLLRPDRITPIMAGSVTSEQIISKYEYRNAQGTKTDIPAENVVFLKFPDPNRQFRGKGTLEAASRVVDIDDYSEKWNLQYFYNGAHPSAAIQTESKLKPSTVERLRRDLKMKHTSAENAHKTIILEQGLKFVPMQLSHKDMEFLEQMKYSRDKILAIFRVPRTAIGITDDVNRANAEATDLVFSKRTIKPKMQRIVEQLNEFFVPMFDKTEQYFLDYDDPVPENQELDLKYYENGLRNGWLTPNEVRTEEGYSPIDGGDSTLAPAGLAPVGNGTTPSKSIAQKFHHASQMKATIDITKATKRARVMKKIEKATEEALAKFLEPYVRSMIHEDSDEKSVKKDESNEEKKELSKDIKGVFWGIMVKIAAIYQKKLEAAIKDLFNRQAKLAIAALNRKKEVKATQDVLLDVEKETKITVRIMTPILTRLMKDQGRQAFDLLSLIDDELDMDSSPISDYLKDRTYELAEDITKVTNEKLGAALAEGTQAGEGIPQLSKRIRTVFDDMAKYRADRIARTETIRASAIAANEAYEQSGMVEQKEWLTALDERTDDDCAEMNGQTTGLKGSFDVPSGGSVDAPPLHPNCRCAVIPVISRSEGYSGGSLGDVDTTDLDAHVMATEREIEANDAKEELEYQIQQVKAQQDELEKLKDEKRIEAEAFERETEKLKTLRDSLIEQLHGNQETDRTD